MTLVLVVLAIVALMVLRVPLYLALGVPATIALVLVAKLLPVVIAERIIESMNNEVLLAIPLFLMMGYILSEGGFARYIIRFCEVWVRHFPGGVAIVTIAGAVFFAGITGSTVAELSALSMFTVPTMESAGYGRRFSLSLVATGATLGTMFPPSVTMILYAYLSQVSIGKLFTAGVLPGLLIASLLAVYSVFYSVRNGLGRLPPATWAERWDATWRGGAILLLPFVIRWAIYSGNVTAVEVGALAVAYTIFLGFVVYRSLTIKGVLRAAHQAARLTSMIFLILAAASVIGFYLGYERIPAQLTAWVVGQNLPQLALVCALALLLLVLGFFLEAAPIIFLVVPVVMPALLATHVNPIYFAVILMISLQLGQIHPPVGMSVMLLSGMYRVDPIRMVVPMLPFIGIMLLATAVLILFPDISLIAVR